MIFQRKHESQVAQPSGTLVKPGVHGSATPEAISVPLPPIPSRNAVRVGASENGAHIEERR